MMSWRRHVRWNSAWWRTYKRWRDSTWNHIPCGREWDHAWRRDHFFFRDKIKHAADEIIAIASPMLRRAVREHRRWITQTIGDTITSNKHHRCLRKHIVNIADVSPMCLRHFEPWCTSPNVRRLLCAARRCSAIYRRWFLATVGLHREKISMNAFNFFSMPDGEAWRLLAYVANHFAEVLGYVALPKLVHR